MNCFSSIQFNCIHTIFFMSNELYRGNGREIGRKRIVWKTFKIQIFLKIILFHVLLKSRNAQPSKGRDNQLSRLCVLFAKTLTLRVRAIEKDGSALAAWITFCQSCYFITYVNSSISFLPRMTAQSIACSLSGGVKEHPTKFHE